MPNLRALDIPIGSFPRRTNEASISSENDVISPRMTKQLRKPQILVIYFSRIAADANCLLSRRDRVSTRQTNFTNTGTRPPISARDTRRSLHIGINEYVIKLIRQQGSVEPIGRIKIPPAIFRRVIIGPSRARAVDRFHPPNPNVGNCPPVCRVESN